MIRHSKSHSGSSFFAEINLTISSLRPLGAKSASISVTNTYLYYSTDLTLYYNQGDSNLDSDSNIQDIILVINHILGLLDFDDTQLSLADLNDDGYLTIEDVILLISYILI